MIKRIIFDLDNTLIKWDDEENWNKVYNSLSNKYGITNQELTSVKGVLNNYELLANTFNKQMMQKMVNNALQKEYSVDFVETILKTFETCVPDEKNQQLEKTLSYLGSKYELVVLTNWYEEQQKIRLDKYGILKYFKNVYGADHFKIKPNKEAFKIAIGDKLEQECIMIGDSIKTDVLGAINAGLNAILYAPNDVDDEVKNEYKIIKDLNELKVIL